MRIALRVVLAAVVVGAIGLLPGTAQAGKGPGPTATLNVTKVVEGEVPADATFTVEVTCPFDIGATEGAWGEGGAPEGPPFENPRVLTFDASGGTQSLDVFSFAPDCTVTETEDGGADSVTYAAGEEDEQCSVTPGTDSATAEFNNAVTCEVIITNSFPEAQPDDVAQEPAAVPLQPAFTG